MAGEKVGEAYVDLVISNDSVNASLKQTEAKIVSALKGWPMELKLKEDPEAFRIANSLQLKVDQITAAEKRRLEAIFEETAALTEQEKALDRQIAAMVAATKNLGGGGNFLSNLLSQGGLQGNQRQLMNQLTYGLQDFATVMTMPGMGIGGALRGAANNFSMILMQLNPLAALISSVAVSALPALFDSFSRTTTATQKQKEATDQLIDSLRKLDEFRQHQQKLRESSDVSGVKTAAEADADLLKTANDRVRLMEHEKDLRVDQARLTKELRGSTTMTASRAFLERRIDPETGERMSLDMIRKEIAYAQRKGIRSGTVDALARSIGIENPEQYQATAFADRVEFHKTTLNEDELAVKKKIKDLDDEIAALGLDKIRNEARLNELREKRVELTKQEADRQQRVSHLQEEYRTFSLPALGETVRTGRLGPEAAERVAAAFAKAVEKTKEIDELEKKGVYTAEEADEQRKVNQRQLKNEVGKVNQQESDRQFNELEASNKRFQARREAAQRFQFGLEMAGAGDRRVFENRRKQAQFELDEDLRRNEEKSPEGSEERKRGAALAVAKFKATSQTITEDEERMKARLRIDALKHANPRQAAIEEAEERRKERLKNLDRLGVTGVERSNMENLINQASAKERLELLRAAERKNPAEFIGGTEMWKKIQLGLLQNDEQKAIADATRQTAENTGKMAAAASSGSGSRYGGD